MGNTCGVDAKSDHQPPKNGESPLETSSVNDVLNRWRGVEVAILKRKFIANCNDMNFLDVEAFLAMFPLLKELQLGPEYIATIFGAFDVYKTGFIDFRELCRGLALCAHGSRKEMLTFCFEMFADVDNIEATPVGNTAIRLKPGEVVRKESSASTTSPIAGGDNPNRHPMGTVPMTSDSGKGGRIKDFDDSTASTSAFPVTGGGGGGGGSQGHGQGGGTAPVLSPSLSLRNLSFAAFEKLCQFCFLVDFDTKWESYLNEGGQGVSVSVAMAASKGHGGSGSGKLYSNFFCTLEQFMKFATTGIDDNLLQTALQRFNLLPGRVVERAYIDAILKRAVAETNAGSIVALIDARLVRIHFRGLCLRRLRTSGGSLHIAQAGNSCTPKQGHGQGGGMNGGGDGKSSSYVIQRPDEIDTTSLQDPSDVYALRKGLVGGSNGDFVLL
eukprot:gene7839-16038_t